MAKQDKTPTPRSLAQHFEAPDDFVGCFGWVCGYSADASFLNIATEYFTRQTRAQRAHEGRIALALVLDSGNPQISMVDVPGVAHLPMLPMDRKPFRLMHAKVALLGFRSNTDDVERWQLRLIVSTGNWTRATLEDSLDLAWRIDIGSADIKSKSAVDSPNFDSQACADVKAAWGLFVWLKSCFDTRILDAAPAGDNNIGTANFGALFESWIKKASAKAGSATPRFFDNRKSSLLAQLPQLVEANGGKLKRNYLAMGSGFYEGADKNNSIPSVIAKLRDSLRENQLLTARPGVDVFVNPDACQAVATCHKQLAEATMTVRRAGYPDFFSQNPPRFLHAKFIFSANYRENSSLCNGAWTYLGSGNLTGPGFNNKASANGGNLEAGVIFGSEKLHWERKKVNVSTDLVVTELLPIQWDDDATSQEIPLAAGGDMPDPDELFIAAPISWLRWREDGDSFWLEATPSSGEVFDVLNTEGTACDRSAEGQYLWSGARPLVVTVRWTINGKAVAATVPVLDKFGRFAATVQPQKELDEAGWLLDSFPMPPDDDELKDGDSSDGSPSTNESSTTSESVAIYPIREMMQFIEQVAAKQTSLCKSDWSAWCVRLEQCLEQASDSRVVKAFLPLELNPLSPLFAAPFRPEFAESQHTDEGQRYEALLHRVEVKWRAASLRKIGGINETHI
jgi:hypothetical protein